jgi:hypothetical protein
MIDLEFRNHKGSLFEATIDHKKNVVVSVTNEDTSVFKLKTDQVVQLRDWLNEWLDQ